MKVSRLNRTFLVLANHLSRLLPAIAAVLCAVHFLSGPTSTAQAAIQYTGNVSPTPPSGGTSSTEGHIGDSSTGTVTVNGGTGKFTKDNCFKKGIATQSVCSVNAYASALSSGVETLNLCFAFFIRVDTTH